MLCPTCGYPVEVPATSASRPNGPEPTERREPPCTRCGGVVHCSSDGSPVRPGTRDPLRDLAHGFVTFFAASLWLFHRREYVGKLLVPVVANVVAVSLALVVLFLGPEDRLSALLRSDWGVLGFLRAPAAWFGATAPFVLAALVFWLVAPTLLELLLAPFLEPLVQATEEAWTRRAIRPVDPGFRSSIARGVRGTATLLGLELLLLVPLLLLALTGIGAALVFLAAALLNAVVWLDVPGSRRAYTLRRRVELVRRNWARASGFGIAFQIGAFVPVYNLVLLAPTAAVAATVLFLHFDKTVAPEVPAADDATRHSVESA